MVNSLWNAPEKVTSTPRGSSSSTLKKIVAAAIALTLSGEPAEAKTYNKQEFPTEMVANVPWTISPMTENVEQSSVTDYINRAENWVRKYHPKYELYFKKIINDIKLFWDYEKYLLNKEIKKSLILLWEWLDENEIITSILIWFENLADKEEFKVKKWISKNDIKYKIWEQISEWFYNVYTIENKNIEGFKKEIELLNWKAERLWINEIENEYIQISEKYMQLLKNRLLNYWELYKSKGAQNRIKAYIEMLKNSNRNPSKIWQKYIDEYNKIKK